MLAKGRKSAVRVSAGLLGRRFRNNPIDFLKKASEKGDVVEFKIGSQRIFFLNHPEYIRDVLVTNAHRFIKGRILQKAKQILNEGLLTSEGELHLRRRRIIQPAFHLQRIAKYSQVMSEYALHWAEERLNGEVLDIDKEMNRLTLRIVAKTLFGANVEDEVNEIGKALTTLVEMFQYILLPFSEVLEKLPLPQTKKLNSAKETLSRVINKIIRERRESGEDRDDLLSMLLMAQDESGVRKMSDEQVYDEVMTLFLAGHETTANALTFAWYLLSQHEDKREKLDKELAVVLDGRPARFEDYQSLKYTEAIFAESIRIYPPVWGLGRLAVEDYEIDGYQIPRGSLVLVSMFVMHRDKRFWDDPDNFIPERWEKISTREASSRFIYFPFGGGTRRCIGEHFAWVEGVILLATIAQKCRFKRVPSQKFALSPMITLRPKYEMKMKVELQ